MFGKITLPGTVPVEYLRVHNNTVLKLVALPVLE
jgi:hypothetical protein